MNTATHTFYLSDFDAEISSVASELGIDWEKAKNRVRFDDTWENNLPALDSKSRGKLSLISSVRGGTHTITFHTKRHGGLSRSWTSRSGIKIDQKEYLLRKKQAGLYKERKDAFYRTLNSDYLGDWKNCRDSADSSFGYLKRKKLQGVNLRLLTETRRKNRNGQKFLAVSVYNHGSLVGLQRIYEDGEKAFTPGTPVSGSYHKIGDHDKKDQPVYVCEGWATGQSIHQATGCAVYCAFNASNVTNIVSYLLKRIDRKQIIVAADNDQWKNNENTGLSSALDINYKYRVKVRFPCFDHIEINGQKPTDFNDLFLLSGISETRKQLMRSAKSTLSVPSVALDYRLKKLSLCGTITSAKNKHLRSAVSAAYKKAYSEHKIIKMICGANSSITKEMVLKALSGIKYAQARRVAGCHSIDPSLHPDVVFIDLPLIRQSHGGYQISDEFFATIKDLKGIVVLKAPMGSGKTETIIKKALECSDKAGYVAHRVSLVEESSNRLNITSYRDVGLLEMSVTRQLANCVNSMNHPKFDGGRWYYNTDLVCIDEGTKVFSHLTGSTVDRPEEVTETFLAALNGTTLGLVCDADANNNLVELLSKHTNKKIYVAQNNPKMDHVKVSITGLEESYNHVVEKACSGETVLVACDAKKDVERLKRSIKQRNKKIRVLDICSETKIREEVDAWIKNPNEESKKWDVVIYNSAVDSGVSITIDHFKHLAGLFRGIIAPDSVIQMMGRNRCARTWIIGCSPLSQIKNLDNPEQKFRALAAANLKIQRESGENPSVIPVASSYDKIRLSMEYSDALCRQDYLLTLNLMLEQKGYKVECKSSEKKHLKEIRKEISELGKEICEENIEMILSAKTPGPLRYRELKNAYAVSKEENAEIIRYEMCQGLGIRDIEKKDIQFWTDNAERKELMIELLQSERKDLFQYDHHQRKMSRSLTRNKHLLVKYDILIKLFSCIKIDIFSAKGTFTHEDCDRFIDYLLNSETLIRIWNYYKLGPHINPDRRPADPTKFVLAVLKKLGLTTVAKLTGKNRLSAHEITKESWDLVNHYVQMRKNAGKHIAKIPAEAAKPKVREEEKEEKEEIIEKPSRAEFCACCQLPIEPDTTEEGEDLCIDCLVMIPAPRE